MVYLVMESGRLRVMPVIRAAYASVEDADAQAKHNLDRDYQRPLQIVDESGAIIKEYPQSAG